MLMVMVHLSLQFKTRKTNYHHCNHQHVRNGVAMTMAGAPPANNMTNTLEFAAN